MNAMSVAESPVKIKNARFVPAMSEYDQGKALYKARRPISECVTDEMAEGWCAAADLAGYMAYSRHMEAEGYTAAQAFAFEGAL